MVGASGLLAASAAVSESVHHGAHVHGAAEITLAMQGPALEIEFLSPAVNIVGFEHRAMTDAQVDAVVAAQKILDDGAAMFSFKGKRCELQAASVDVSAVWDGADEREEKDDHDDADEHGEQHEHGEHHEHDESHEGKKPHSDITASYTFNCEGGGRLEAVTVGSDKLPFDLETINAMWVTESAQGSRELTADNRVIALQ